MTARLYPAALYRPVSYASGAGGFAAAPLGWIEHVVVGNGSPFGTFEHAVSPSRRFSHLWFAKDGRVEQYQTLDRISWAQVAGNGTYWSCETEGFPTEALTGAQLDALAAWHVWCGAVDIAATTPGQRGIGTHQMGGGAWGGHACPGPVRAGQRADIIRRAQALRHPTPAPIPAPAITQGDDMFVIATSASTDKSVPNGAVYQVAPGVRHHITDPAVWSPLVSKGGAVAVPLTGDQIAAQWPAVVPQAPSPAVDVAALVAGLAGPLAAAVAADLPTSPAGTLTSSDVEAALRTVLHGA